MKEIHSKFKEIWCREEIDNLRRERVVFDQINAKLAFELHEKKKEMAQIIEISNIAYEARDQAQNEMALLKVIILVEN